MRFIVVTIVAVDQQLYTGILILADQVDGLGNRADKTPQRPAVSQSLTFCRHCGLIASEQPTVIMGPFDRRVVAASAIAVTTKHRQLVPDHVWIAADVAGLREAGDRA